jgi:hypothetical protein
MIYLRSFCRLETSTGGRPMEMIAPLKIEPPWLFTKNEIDGSSKIDYDSFF